MTQAVALPPVAFADANSSMPSFRGKWVQLCAGVIVLAYAAYLLLVGFVPAISNPDDNGYFAQATLLFQTGHTWFHPGSNAQYVGMHWLLTPSGNYVSRYPPGLPIFIGVIYALFGYKAAVLANPILAILSVIGMYLLSRRILSPAWSLAATVALVTNSILTSHALSGDSHVAVTCCVVWGIYFLVRWSQEGELWQLFLAGLVLGCVPTVRYPDSILALSVGVFLLMSGRKFSRRWRHYVAACVGAAIPIVPLLIRNQLIFGAFWRTGYSLTNEETGFGWNYFKEHAVNYIRTIHGDGVGLLFALGLVGMVWMICLRKMRALGLMFALFTVPMLLLYMAYYWGPQGMANATMRFLLPTFPMYILAGIWALAHATESAPRPARVAIPIVLLLVQGLMDVPETLGQTRQQSYQKEMLARMTDALDQVATRDDVVLAGNQLSQHLDFVRKWKLADSSLMRGFGGPGGPGGGPGGMRRGSADPDEPSPMQAEKQKARSAIYKGTDNERMNQFEDDLEAWAAGHKIYLVGSEQEVKNMLGRDATVTTVKRVAMPAAPPMEMRGGIGGPGGMRGGFAALGGPGGPGGLGGPGGNFLQRGPGGPQMANRTMRIPFAGGGPMPMPIGEREMVIAEVTFR